MDAEIAVQSEPQQGSTFIIQMPFKLLPAVPITDSKIDDLSGLNCLILGDHDGLGNDLTIYLKSAGAMVEQISDLSSIQQLIQNLVFGLWFVVIDVG